MAILDPTLSLTQPRVVTEAAGLDALGHALETAVTTARTDASWRYSLEAFRLGYKSFSRVLAAPDDLPARASMLLAASYAGLAIESSMLGAAHACANPLTESFGLRHGFAVGAALPSVVSFNAQKCSETYAVLATSAGISEQDREAVDSSERLARALELIVGATSAAQEWASLGISSADTAQLAADAARQRTASFNPRKVGEEEFAEIYASVFEGMQGGAP